jgi:DNA-binding response OmpR family regulator
VEHARRFRPDIILMDRRMRDLDGLEATRRIHDDAATAHIPVIAVSASTFSDSHEAARQAGCVDFLPKPVRAEALFSALQRHLGVTFVAGPAAEPPHGRAAVPFPRPADGGRDGLALARRLRSAAAVGDVAEIEAIAGELAGDGDRGALARQIAQLNTGFEFEALVRLADRLESQDEVERAAD